MEYKLEDLSINPEVLANNNYKSFIDSTRKYNEGYVESWQKTVYNDYGKAYFINFEFHDMSSIYSQHKIDGNPYSWQADMQLNTFDDMTINIEVLGCNRDLESVENFCAKMFKQMQFKNYDYFSEEEEYKHKKEIAIVEEVKALEEELPKNNTAKSSTKKKKI